MLQHKVTRLSGFNISSFIIVCNKTHRFNVEGQLREIDSSASIMLEPVNRDTGPAIPLAPLTGYSCIKRGLGGGAGFVEVVEKLSLVIPQHYVDRREHY